MISNPDNGRFDGEDVEPLQLRTLRHRIRERMTTLGLSGTALSRSINQGSTYIWDLLNGKNDDPSSEAIQSIAKELHCSTDYLYGHATGVYGSSPPLRVSIPYAGIAEAGAFRQMAGQMTDRHDQRFIEHPSHPFYPAAHHFYLDVRGDDMNACTNQGRPTPIYEGMSVICVDLASAGVAVESNNIYAVRRTLDGGQTWEISIRRAMVYVDRIELSPETTNPALAKFIIPRPNQRQDVEVIGLVYSWVYNFQR